MQVVRPNEVGHRTVRLVLRVDLDDRLRPEAARVIFAVNLIADVVRSNFGEGSSKRAVLINHQAIEIENVHCSAPSRALAMQRPSVTRQSAIAFWIAISAHAPVLLPAF